MPSGRGRTPDMRPIRPADALFHVEQASATRKKAAVAGSSVVAMTWQPSFATQAIKRRTDSLSSSAAGSSTSNSSGLSSGSEQPRSPPGSTRRRAAFVAPAKRAFSPGARRRRSRISARCGPACVLPSCRSLSTEPASASARDRSPAHPADSRIPDRLPSSASPTNLQVPASA